MKPHYQQRNTNLNVTTSARQAFKVIIATEAAHLLAGLVNGLLTLAVLAGIVAAVLWKIGVLK